MSIRRWLAVGLVAPFIAGTAPGAAQVGAGGAHGDSKDLVKVKSKYFDEVYLRPGADFRGYTRVMVDATQVTFAERWRRDLNAGRIAVLQGTTAAEAGRIAEGVRAGSQDRFANVFRSAGYDVVTAPGDNVLGVSLRLTDLYIRAPSTVTNALPSRVYTHTAGEATLILELRDTATGTLLGRIVDRRMTATRGTDLQSSVQTAGATTSATNRFDFESMFGLWAMYCIDELQTAESQAAPKMPPPND